MAYRVSESLAKSYKYTQFVHALSSAWEFLSSEYVNEILLVLFQELWIVCSLIQFLLLQFMHDFEIAQYHTLFSGYAHAQLVA